MLDSSDDVDVTLGEPVPPVEGDDAVDEIVLPWWTNPAITISVIVVVAALAGVIGWTIGEDRFGSGANDVDVGFLQDMRPHHEQAVAMSVIYLGLDDTDPDLRLDARGIEFGQTLEIGRMIQLLLDFGQPEVPDTDVVMEWMHPGMGMTVESMPGMATRDELDTLAASSGPEADRLFATMMIAHHQAGVEMAEFAAANAGTDVVRTFASNMARNQGLEIAEMQGHLADVEAGN
jgi:uncharacterized protein (DUF305 family)